MPRKVTNTKPSKRASSAMPQTGVKKKRKSPAVRAKDGAKNGGQPWTDLNRWILINERHEAGDYSTAMERLGRNYLACRLEFTHLRGGRSGDLEMRKAAIRCLIHIGQPVLPEERALIGEVDMDQEDGNVDGAATRDEPEANDTPEETPNDSEAVGEVESAADTLLGMFNENEEVKSSTMILAGMSFKNGRAFDIDNKMREEARLLLNFAYQRNDRLVEYAMTR